MAEHRPKDWSGWRGALLAPLNRLFQLFFLASIVLVPKATASPSISLLDPAGPVAAMQREWTFEILIAILVVVIPVFVGVPFCLWRYRIGNRKAAYKPDWNFNVPLEFLVWGAPFVIVILLSILIWGPELRYSPANPVNDTKPLNIQVVALNWKWLFIYPDQHVASLDTLALPTGRDISFTLTSDNTMQSFFIPALGSQIYAMAGMVTRLHLLADRTGRLMGENTQFNGMGFQDEKFTVSALAPADFASWVEQAAESPVHLDNRTYALLAKDGNDKDFLKALSSDGPLPSNALQPQGVMFSNPPDDFFLQIVNHYHQPPIARIMVPQ